MLKEKILDVQKRSFSLESLLIIYGNIRAGASMHQIFTIARYSLGYLISKIYLRFFIEPLISLRQKMINTGVHQIFRSGHYDYFPLLYPLNNTERLRSLFSDKFQAARKMKIKEFNNALLWLEQGCGIVFSDKKLERQSFHKPWYMGSHRVISGYYKGLARFFAREKAQPVEQGEKLYLVSHWHNYYHWMVETLYRVTFLSETAGSATIILPQSIKATEFVRGTLGAFPNIQVQYLDDRLRFFNVPQLALVSCKGDCEDYSPAILQKTRERILSTMVQPGMQTYKRVYISRHRAPNRKIANEEEVIALLQKSGFAVLYFEELSFAEQVNIAANAEVIVGMHGAGLTNILFRKPGASVLELHRSMLKPGDHHSKVYWKLACALGHNYFFQECPPANVADNFYKADIVVDINLLQANIEMMLNYKP